jgi:hypothetical protein
MSGIFDKSLPQAFYPALPNVFAMTMRLKIAQGTNSTDTGPTADGYSPVKTVNVRRRPPTQDELVRANLLGADRIVMHCVLNDGTDVNFVAPQIETRITDEVGVQWTVKQIKETILETVYDCTCVQGW